MPSPIGHILGGAAVYLGTSGRVLSRFVLGATLLGSIIPDLDFLPGILIGDMRAFHHGVSHSLAAAGMFGALVFVTGRLVAPAAAGRAAVLAAVAYASHVLLDLISVNEGTRGVPLFWPVWDRSLGVSLHLFGHFRYGDISEGIWSVARRVNISPLLRELAILGGLVAVLGWKRRPSPR